MNKIKAIRNDEDYRTALAMLEELIDQNPEPETEPADQLEILSLLIDRYESEAFPLNAPSAIDAIKFCMEQKDLKPVDLVPYLGSKSRVSEILSGKRQLTVEMIRALEQGLGIPASILLRKSPETEDTIFQNWDNKLFKEMVSRNYFDDSHISAQDQSATLKQFFENIVSPSKVPSFLRQSSYRSVPTTDRNALAAWSAKVLKEAKKIKLNKTYVQGSVDEDFMQSITKLSTHLDGPIRAKESLEQIGIILIIEPHLPKTRLDGAVLLLDNKIPVIGMTLRHDRADNFWFTLLHELAHIKLHLSNSDTERFFDELDEIKGFEISATEKEADNLASESLIPSDKWLISPARLIPSPLAAKSLANDVGVDISIVAGKIRYESGNWSYLNSLISKRTVSDIFSQRMQG